MQNQKTLARIRALAIPPAYHDVWICPDPRGHIQATGRDARGRKQYRYHPDWRAVRDGNKYAHALAFGHALPAILTRVAADLARPGLGRERTLATTMRLLDRTLMRIGNRTYSRENGSEAERAPGDRSGGWDPREHGRDPPQMLHPPRRDRGLSRGRIASLVHGTAAAPAGPAPRRGCAAGPARQAARAKAPAAGSGARFVRNHHIQLGKWWARQGSNLWPPRCQHGALPLSYAPKTPPLNGGFSRPDLSLAAHGIARPGRQASLRARPFARARGRGRRSDIRLCTARQ